MTEENKTAHRGTHILTKLANICILSQLIDFLNTQASLHSAGVFKINIFGDKDLFQQELESEQVEGHILVVLRCSTF